ncbi:transporter substrate-binding domain-containing protein [Chitinivorax sp. B]|uniref:substrate-binding periplasmic protein n=1 Tax=Chitinivorax sp. B TaxID=2502235 RepID=UPI001485A73B|nr:transporter substrate-binding domain-containing protein [Chitinivorax sp. B]
MLIGIWVIPWRSFASQVMEVSTLLEPDPATTVATRILTEAYAELGITLNVIKMPGERSLVSANVGSTDGELYRKLGMEQQYANLRIIPVMLMRYEIVAFCKCTPFQLNGWESLRPYRLGFVKGIKIVEANTVGMKIEPVPTLSQAFDKLELGRSDLVLVNRLSGVAMQQQKGMTDITQLMPALASFPVFHYVHKKHEALIPQLTEVMRRLEKNGVIERINHEVFSELERRPPTKAKGK